jgi:HSP20 family protein
VVLFFLSVKQGGCMKRQSYTSPVTGILVLLMLLLLVATAQISSAKDSSNQSSADPVTAGSTQTEQKQQDRLVEPFGFSNWDPYEEIQAMRQQMDQLFNAFDNRLQLSPFFRKGRQPFAIVPQADVEKTDKQYIVTMNIPGAENGEINVSLEENRLSVSASTVQNYEETKGRRFIRMERSTGSIHRVMSLPDDVDNNGMTSKYKDGVLTVIIPRKKPSS